MADAIGKVMKALGALEPANRVQVLRACLGMCLQVHPELAEERTKSPGAIRQGRYRQRHAGASPPSPRDVTGDATSDAKTVTGDVTSDAFARHKGGGGGSLSPDSVQDSPSREQIREVNVTEAPRANEETLFAMPEDWEIDEETRAAAAIMDLKDPVAAWAAFRAENLDKPPRSARAWRAKFRDQWAPRARKFEQQDAPRGPKPVRQPVASVRAWQGGEEWRGAK